MTEMRVSYIYGLTDPRTNEVRYIGKSIRPTYRLSDHCNDRSTTYRTNWIRELKSLGLRPGILILERIEAGEDWAEAERRWIVDAAAMGFKLTNCTSGGDGVSGLPEEVRTRMAKTWTGRKHKPETLAKIGASSKLRRWSPQRKELMRSKFEGRVFSDEWAEKISRSLRKLTNDQVREIKALLAIGANQYSLADRFGVHQGTISNISRGLSYAEVQ